VYENIHKKFDTWEQLYTYMPKEYVQESIVIVIAYSFLSR